MTTAAPVHGAAGVRRRVPRALLYLAVTAGALAMIYPIVWMFAASLKPDTEIFTDLGLIPQQLDLANYPDGWTGLGLPFSRFFLNSFLVAGSAVIANLVSCSLAAYAFARLRFPARSLWFAVMLGTIMLPYHVTLIPQYTLFFELGWINTYLPMIVPKMVATDAFFIFLFVQFIRGIPVELDQAAKIDGAGPVRTYTAIILPLLRPALVTGAIFTFIWTYNDFLGPLLYISDTRLYTVPLALRAYLDTTGQSAWGPMFAMSALSLVPLVVLFMAFQRQIVEGIATSGLKG